MAILKSYNSIVMPINNRNLFVIVSKLYEVFVLTNVVNPDRQRRLLGYMAMIRYLNDNLGTNGLVVNGINVGVEYGGISPYWHNVKKWIENEVADWNGVDWFFWGLTEPVCTSHVAMSCAYEVYDS